LKYTKSDEWVRAEGKKATIGITDYAQEQLSDIVFVEVTAAVGETVEQGAAFASVESVKAASEVYLPATGVVRAVNEALPDKPELINSDPYGEAWMIQIELSDPASLNDLMDAEAYQAYCEERSH
jgi:glycine cleavage system H protein